MITGLIIDRFKGNGIVVQSDGNTLAGNIIGIAPGGPGPGPNGTYPGSGAGAVVIAQAGLDGRAQFERIRQYVNALVRK